MYQRWEVFKTKTRRWAHFIVGRVKMRNNEASTLSGCEGGVFLKLRSFNSCDFPTNEGAKYHNNNWDAMETATEHSLKCTPSLKLFFLLTNKARKELRQKNVSTSMCTISAVVRALLFKSPNRGFYSCRLRSVIDFGAGNVHQECIVCEPRGHETTTDESWIKYNFKLQSNECLFIYSI